VASVGKNIPKNIRGKCQFPGQELEKGETRASRARFNFKFETHPELILVLVEIRKRKDEERNMRTFRSRQEGPLEARQRPLPDLEESTALPASNKGIPPAMPASAIKLIVDCREYRGGEQSANSRRVSLRDPAARSICTRFAER